MANLKNSNLKNQNFRDYLTVNLIVFIIASLFLEHDGSVSLCFLTVSSLILFMTIFSKSLRCILSSKYYIWIIVFQVLIIFLMFSIQEIFLELTHILHGSLL